MKILFVSTVCQAAVFATIFVLVCDVDTVAAAAESRIEASAISQSGEQDAVTPRRAAAAGKSTSAFYLYALSATNDKSQQPSDSKTRRKRIICPPTTRTTPRPAG